MTIYWCGSEAGYCNLPSENNVYPKATHVIIAYIIVDGEGNLSVDSLPKDLIDEWHADGKKVLLSVGGAVDTINNIKNN